MNVDVTSVGIEDGAIVRDRDFNADFLVGAKVVGFRVGIAVGKGVCLEDGTEVVGMLVGTLDGCDDGNG